MIPRNASDIKIEGFNVNVDYNVLNDVREIILKSISIPDGTIVRLRYKIGKKCCRRVRIRCNVVGGFILEE